LSARTVPEIYRQRAAELRLMAKTCENDEVRASLLRTAEIYDRLAKNANDNGPPSEQT
jgi:hypothetical protein